MANTMAWFPPGMSPEDKQLLLDAYPGDPHAAASDAWYDYAAAMDPATQDAATVQSVSTGAQTVTYAAGGSSSPHDAAIERGDWHKSRARAKSVRYGSDVRRQVYGDIRTEVDDMLEQGDGMPDAGTIDSAYFPPIGETLPG